MPQSLHAAPSAAGWPPPSAAAGIGPTATRIRIEAERLEEQARRLRTQIGPSTPTYRASVDTADLARRRDTLVARSSWNQVRRQGRR